MSRLIPISRQEFISRLKELGFDGPHSGGKHQYMIKGSIRLTVPNPHKKEIGVELLSRLLKQADISRDEWTKK
jgi:predicted RNA binding protein YcfA (HicA-like mRNA interferase family)